MSNVDVTAVVMCDDIRKEVTNKDILIGVYTTDVLVPAFPCQVNFAFWIELVPRRLGQNEIELRLSLNDKPPVLFKIGLNVTKEGEPLAVTLPAMQITLEAENQITLELKEGEDWRPLKTKRIILGNVPQAFTVSTAEPSEPSPPHSVPAATNSFSEP